MASNAYRDTNAAMGRAIRYGRGHQLANIFKDKKYLDELKDYKKILEKNQIKLNELYDKLIDLFGKENFDSSIMDNLMIIMQNQQGELPSYDILKQLINSSFSTQTQGQQRALTDFLYEYWSTKNEFLTIAEKMETTNLGLAGSKSQDQYYDIFLHNVQDNTPNAQPMNKLIQLTREQYEKFEKVNPEIFERTSFGYGLKQGISTQEIYNRMLALFPEERGPIDILDQVFAQTTKNGQTYNLQTRDIYNILRAGGRNMFQVGESGITRLSEITQSRRLEMLFDSDLITGIQSLINSKDLNAQGKLTVSKKEIQEVIKGLDFNKYKGENIYGGVAGDVSLIKNGIMEEHQLKYKYNTWAPWNGRNYGAVINNINAYINTGQQFLQNPLMMNDLALGAMTSDQFFDFIGADAQTEYHFEEMSYAVVNDSFLSDMGDGIPIEITI